MNKVSYAKMNLKVNTDVNTFEFQGNQIEVLRYLPIEDKNDLVMVTLQNSLENGIYNDVKMTMFFHVYLVYLYSNLSFTDKQKENPAKIYDCLVSNGFMSAFLDTIDEDEYNDLVKMVESMADQVGNYTNSAGGIVKSLVEDLPKNAEAAAKVVENFDPQKYQAVVNFAKAANGNRPL